MSLETFAVLPSNKHGRPAAPSEIKLHSIDVFSSCTQIRSHLTFMTPASPAESIDKLKRALAEALELYPPVNGTVITKDDGCKFIALDDNHLQATPLIIETRDGPYEGDSEDLSPRQGLMVQLDSPIFAAKVTLFSCGTMVIASSMNHLVCDLRGFLDFVELWARLTRGEQVDYTKIPDDWTRTPQRFFAPHNGKLTVPPGITVGDSSQDTVQVAPAPSTITRWHVPAAKVAQLKRDLAPDDDEMWISTNDALTVLISGAVTRARETSKVERQTGQVGFTRRTPADHGVETIVLLADIREQALLGDMANGRYFGNAIIALVVPVSRADLMSPTATAASRAAVAIRNHIKQRLSQKEISGHLAFLENPGILVPGRTSCVTDIFVTNWCKFDLDGPKFDFGWGKPSNYTDGIGTETSFPPAFSFMRQKKDSGDVFMLVTVEVPGADALKNDPLLTKYGELL